MPEHLATSIEYTYGNNVSRFCVYQLENMAATISSPFPPPSLSILCDSRSLITAGTNDVRRFVVTATSLSAAQIPTNYGLAQPGDRFGDHRS